MAGLGFNHRLSQFYVRPCTLLMESLHTPYGVPTHSLWSPCTLLPESLHTPSGVLAHSFRSPCTLLPESLHTPYGLLSNLSFIMYPSPEGVCKESSRSP